MMNLSEFLDNWDNKTQIVVERNAETVFCGKVADMSEDAAKGYWIPEAGAKYDKGIMYIAVEHEDDVNRRIEEQNNISFSAIWENVKNDAELNGETKKQFDYMINAANDYTHYRKKWNKFSDEFREQLNEERLIACRIYISELDNMAELAEKATGKKAVWRAALGDDRYQLGDFAEYMISNIENVRTRISILKAIKWAQEHQNQIYHLFDEAIDGTDARLQLEMKYNLSAQQADAIRDMRLRAFCDEQKAATKKELEELQELEKLYPNILD